MTSLTAVNNLDASDKRIGPGQPEKSDQKLIEALDREIRGADITRLTRQLKTLLTAGLAVVPALRGLEDEFKGTRLAELIRIIRSDVEAGLPLTESLKRFPSLFSPIYVSMVAAAHSSGRLEEALERIIEFMEKRQKLRNKIISAVAYPTVTSIVAVCVVTFLLSYVVPNITEIFDEMDQSLPGITRGLMAVSDFVRGYFVLGSIALFGLIFAGKWWFKTEAGQLAAVKIKFGMPVLGKLLKAGETARISRTLGTLLASDVPLVQALQITEPVTSSVYVRNSLAKMRNNIEQGMTVAQAVNEVEFFSPLMHHMLSAGQVSGRLEDSLRQVAEIYEEQVENSTKLLTSMMEPALLIVMGGIIALIVSAILLPILEMNDLF